MRFENHYNIYQNINVKKWEKSFEDIFEDNNIIDYILYGGFNIDKFCKLTDNSFKINSCRYNILEEPFQNYDIFKIRKRLEKDRRKLYLESVAEKVDKGQKNWYVPHNHATRGQVLELLINYYLDNVQCD